MTNDLINRLMSAGLNKQQATSVTAETLVKLFMPEDGKILIKEAQLQVAEMQKTVKDLKQEYSILVQKIQSISEVLLSVSKAQKEFGCITDSKAQNVIALYASLLSMNKKIGADPSDSVKNAGYIMYAYLGGQAKREITHLPE